MLFAILGLLAASFVISWLATWMIRPLAAAIGFVDRPGGRKIHSNPKPLGGGVAIFLGFALPVLVGLAYVRTAPPPPDEPTIPWRAYWSGAGDKTPLALEILGAAALLHLLGLIDDRRALGPYPKLIVQLAVTTALVWFANLRVLTALGPWASLAITVLWITAITNAFNFLDNMDGLSAGIAAVSRRRF